MGQEIIGQRSQYIELKINMLGPVYKAQSGIFVPDICAWK